jgi:hypothetical protein
MGQRASCKADKRTGKGKDDDVLVLKSFSAMP